MRSCSPSRYSVSTVSSVRQTIQLGGNIQLFLACSTYAYSPGPRYQPPVLLMDTPSERAVA
jgi:hypothetical protein